jgi:hypothetical protein
MQYRLSPEAEIAFREYLARRRALPHFANARSIRNALDRARLRHASRLLQRGPAALSQADLLTIEAADIRASRVFTASEKAVS